MSKNNQKDNVSLRDPYAMVAKLPDRVLLMKSDDTIIYAIGWSINDLLLEVESIDHGQISVVATGRPFRGFINHAPHYVSEMDEEVIKSLWRNRPAASWMAVPED